MSRLDLKACLERGTRHFLEAWYGVDLLGADARWGSQPKPLREWWGWQEASDVAFIHQNHLLSELRSRDQFTVFYVENQAVVQWAYETASDDPDPEVFERTNADQSAWEPLGMPMSQFLLLIACFEAAIGAEHALWVNDPTAEHVDLLTDGLALADGAAFWEMQVYVGDEAVLTLHSNTVAIYSSPDPSVIEGKRDSLS